MNRERILVHWYSSEEWNDVFKKVFSNDIQSMEEGYRKLCVWNARSPYLPAGIENTMELLQVFLCDQKRNYSEKDLALMYSSAIIRFMNHIKEMHRKSGQNRHASLYDMAADYGLPDWLVNIRHEVSHECSLPSIHILRSTYATAFDWLRENYWFDMAGQIKDLIIADTSVFGDMERRVRILLTLWQATKIQCMLKRYHIEDIPNEKLRYHLSFLLNENEICIGNGVVELKELLECGECGEANNIKVTSAKRALKENFRNLLPKERTNSEQMEKMLVDQLVQSELFIPKGYNSALFVKDDTLNTAFSSLWDEILIAYHEADLTTDLIYALVSITNGASEPSQRLIAACWISHICQSLLEAGQPVMHTEDMKTKPSNIRKLFALILLEKEQVLGKDTIEFLFCNKLLPIKFSSEHHLKNFIFENAVNESVSKANSYSRIYLKSLLDLLNPPLTMTAREDLLQLIDFYTDTSKSNYQSDTTEIFTVESLKLMNTNVDEETSMEIDEPKQKDAPGWTRNHGISGWSKCALGCLPPLS